jgi:hypothetical protein
MGLINIDVPAAAKVLADEAAAQLEPILQRIVTAAVAQLKGALIGRTITFTITIK